MKIYKLDIDTSKPTRQIVAMQQNSTGLLSVNVTNDGKYIRNLSCTVYDGENEISATTENGYKIDVGTGNKVIKVVAKSTPDISMDEYIVSAASGTRLVQQALNKVQIQPGVYNQDEFASLTSLGAEKAKDGMMTTLAVHASNLSATNFSMIALTPWNPTHPITFVKMIDYDYRYLPPDEQISASEEISVQEIRQVRTNNKNSIMISAVPYPAVGYWTDYQKHTVVTPSTNANCYAEQDIQEPTPEEQQD